MLEASFGGRVLARSNRTVVLEGNPYCPPQDVEQRFLTRTRTNCLRPWKGIASYYTVDVDGVRSRNAAWTYHHPSPFARRIKNHLAFWAGARVNDTDQPAGSE